MAMTVVAYPALLLPATAQTNPAMPVVVRKDVAHAMSDGGPPPPIPRGMVRPVDVNRDGIADWLIDYAKAGETIWCGQGGCRYKLFVSTGRGAYAVAFDEMARSFRVRPEGSIEVDVYGSYCASYGADACRRDFVWSSREALLLPLARPGQRTWLFGPLFNPVVVHPAMWPAAVAAAVARRAAVCTAAGGTLDEADGAIVRSPDLDGDGRADWIIGSPYSACVSRSADTDRVVPDLARPTLVVLSGAKPNATPLFEGPDANYAVDMATTPARLRIIPGDEERLQRCADRPQRCGGRALRLDASGTRLIDPAD